MPTKIFTVNNDPCPFGRGCVVDSKECRNCPDYYRAGTAMFFWCANNLETATDITPKKRVRKTANPDKARKRPVNRKKSGKR